MSTSEKFSSLVVAGHEWSPVVDDCAIPDIRLKSSRSGVERLSKELGFELPPAYLDIVAEVQGFYPKQCIVIVWESDNPLDDTDADEATYMVVRTFLVIVGSESGDEFGAELMGHNADVGNGVETFAFYRAQLPESHQHLFPIASDYRSNLICLDFRQGPGVPPFVVYYDRAFGPEDAVFAVAPSFETFLDTLMMEGLDEP